jgi:DNA-binding response OmpR family regulator
MTTSGSDSSQKAHEADQIPTSLLIVDDDAEICDLLQRYFEEHGYIAHIAADGDELEQVLGKTEIDLIILDIMLPGDDGFILCRGIRSRSDIPIIMITANNDELDRIIGLELGADDYVSKPFNARELLARVKAVLRRQNGKQEAVNKPVRYRHFGNWKLDCLTRTLEQDGTVTSLGGPEFRLLNIMLNHPNQVISRDELSHASLHREHVPYDRTIDIQVSRLRQLLRDSGKEPELIKTVRGTGYIFLSEVTDEL